MKAIHAGYDEDFYRWTQETADAIKAGRFEGIDLAALSDEVESLGKRHRFSVISRLQVILLHLLKQQYQPERATRSWQGSLIEQRGKVQLLLEDSPSLSAQLPELLPRAYKLARVRAAFETRLDIDTFPENCPFSLQEILGGD